MPGTDRTADFREALADKRHALPESKRRKISRPSKSDTEREGHTLLGKEYISEAYVVVRR
jgi:syntaxin 18